MRSLFAGLAVTAAAFGASPAMARDHPSARLQYDRDAGAAACPTQPGVEAAVRAHLGYDPFVPSAGRTILLRVSRRADGFAGRLEVQNAGGAAVGGRELVSPDCDELISSMSISIAISIDPLALSRAPAATPLRAPAPPVPPPAAPPAPPPVAPPAVDKELPVPPPPNPVHLGVGVGVLGSIGSEPKPDIGVVVEGDVRWRRLSLGLEGRADIPTSANAPNGGTVTAYLLLASLVPCVHNGILVGCALGSIGGLFGSAEGVTRHLQKTTLYGAAGARLGVEIPVYGPFAVAVHADVLAAITRTSLNLSGDQGVWTTPAVAGLLGALAVAKF